MKIMIVSDAWSPQVNGVVRTLQTTRQHLEASGFEVQMVTPDMFRTFPCPTYPEIRLAWKPRQAMLSMMESFDPDFLHIATEGPLGWTARSLAIKTDRPFTTAYHTRFPEYVKARFGIPLSITYALMRRFHKPSKGVMVATESVKNDLRNRGIHHLKGWSRGVDFSTFRLPVLENNLQPTSASGKPPVFLFAGRVAIEKNIEAFLKLTLPGEKWVAGDGPQMGMLKAKYPEVRWLGMLSHEALAKVYQQASVFVFPSRTDTFGLVLLEAMACGLPVAAYPVTGPVDVIGNSGAGVLDEDLQKACLQALSIPKELALKHAQGFNWTAATQQFVSNLHRIDKSPEAVFKGDTQAQLSY